MKIGKPTAQQAKTVQATPREGTGELSGWSFSTSMRNPERLAQVLDVVMSDSKARARRGDAERIWNADTQGWLYDALKAAGFYTESRRKSDQVGGATRGRTAMTPAAQLGFVRATSGQPLRVTPLGQRYARALKANDTALMEDCILLALYRLRMKLNAQGKPSHREPGDQGPFTAPLGHILDLFLDAVGASGGLSLERAKYLIPLATAAAHKDALARAIQSPQFMRDLPALVQGKVGTLRDYGDTLLRYLLLSGLFKLENMQGWACLILAPGREDQARRLRDDLVGATDSADWEAYRRDVEADVLAPFPWHGSQEDYANDCQALAKALERLTSLQADYDVHDPRAHLALRTQLGRAYEQAYLSSGRSLVDLPDHLNLIRAVVTPGNKIRPLDFEVAVLRAGTALGGISRFAPNYTKDMWGNPLSHAPGNDGDGWIHGQADNGPHLLLEASLVGGRQQLSAEWEPARRHLTQKKVDGQDIDSEAAAGLLVMPTLHGDAVSACVRDARDLDLEDHPAYLLLITHAQYARLLENTVAGSERLATVEELVDWIQATCRKVGKEKNGRDPGVYSALLDQEIEAWDARMMERLTLVTATAEPVQARRRMR